MIIKTTEPAVTVDGRILGQQALATRHGLAEALAHLLRSQPFRDIKIIDIARQARVSPATYYQYFTSVEDALQLVAADVLDSSAQQLASDSTAVHDHGGELADARRVINRLFDVWQTHQAVIRAIDAKAAEGDKRFVEIRNQLLSAAEGPVREAMERRRSSAPATARPKVLVGAMVTLVTSAASHESGFAAWGTSDELRDCLALLLVNSVVAA